MAVRELAEMTWEEVRDLDRSRAILVLPTGAVEAHGPHLPLGTDDIIARAMAGHGAELLAGDGFQPVLLPPISYTAASFAAAFPGTLTVQPQAVAATIVDIGRAAARHDLRTLAIANAHLDPVHLGSLRRAVDALTADEVPIRVVFPDLTRKPWALRLTDEFRSGACHAGRFEGSVVLAERPDLVRHDVAAGLAEVPASLSEAIRAGKTSFAAAGGPRAYFGAPAAASAEEGRETIRALGQILRDAVLEEIGPPDGASGDAGEGDRMTG